LDIRSGARLPPRPAAGAIRQPPFVTIYNSRAKAGHTNSSTSVVYGSQGPPLKEARAGTTYPNYHEGTMTTTRGLSAHPIEFAAAGGLALLPVARAAVAAVAALVLCVAGWRPASVASVAAPAAPAAPAAVAPLVPAAAALTVIELRQMARAAGHRALARSGRRADLLAALALA